MGQQQLLLLVLSTVIVGLATVAGIEAFSEGKTRATQDALQQRAMTIGANLQATLSEPTQFRGGSSNVNAVVIASGYDGKDKIPAPGAGNDAACDVEDGQTVGNGNYTNGMTVICAEKGMNSDPSGQPGNSGSGQTVTVEVGERSGPIVVRLNGNTVSGN